MRRQPPQPVVVGQHAVSGAAQRVDVPDADQRRAAPADSAAAARRGNGSPSPRRRPAAPGTCPTRRRARSPGRPATTANSARRPSRGSRTCARRRCRTRRPPSGWWTARRSAGRPPPRPARRRARRAPPRRWSAVSSVVKVFEATRNSVRAGSSPCTAAWKACPSTLDRKRASIRASVRPMVSASVATRGSEIGPADADVHHRGQALAGRAALAALVHRGDEAPHAVAFGGGERRGVVDRRRPARLSGRRRAVSAAPCALRRGARSRSPSRRRTGGGGSLPGRRPRPVRTARRAPRRRSLISNSRA